MQNLRIHFSDRTVVVSAQALTTLQIFAKFDHVVSLKNILPIKSQTVLKIPLVRVTSCAT